MKKRILGIDTGSNSLGWAVVDKNEEGTYSLITKGSLIFQEGVKIEKGIESSKAADRTSHRALRKQYFRRRFRKIKVLEVLIDFGWCPRLTYEELHTWHMKKIYPKNEAFISWQRTNDNYGRNPYYYRHRCLHEQLDLANLADRYVLGRAMYHLAQRRGFLSNRLEQSDEKETGKVKEAIDSLSKSIAEAGCEYLGDYFYRIYKEKGNTTRIRSNYTDREKHYKREFYAICRRQNLTDTQVETLERALYFQRPLKSQRRGVGWCTFEPKKHRVPDSHPSFELFRMLSFVNSIKVKGPYDVELRHITAEEFDRAKPKFFRKTKTQFDFEDIAKAIAGKGKYQYIKDPGDKEYKFNYRMTQNVAGCHTISSLISIFGEDYERAIAERYTLADGKTTQQMVNDVWNVLYSFPDKDKVRQWGKERLQMCSDEADKFADITLTHNFASLSLSAINKILPWLKQGLIYSHAVLMAKVPDIVGKEVWKSRGDSITDELLNLISNFDPKDIVMTGTLEFCIKDILKDMCCLELGAIDKLYHPSMIDVYPDAEKNSQGIFQLGSPKTNAVRNPMAMRSLHQLRRVINALLREGTIDNQTEVHIEYARELNDANKRAAIYQWNKDKEKQKKQYAEDIKSLYKQECGRDIEPGNDDIVKFQLWEEQGRICLYTGNQIGICEFLCPNPSYDIEHTIPQSVGGDSTLENITLCSSEFNREKKRTKLPTQLANYDEIIPRLEEWRKKIEKLRKEIDRTRTTPVMAKDIKDRVIQKRHRLKLELDYWVGKYKRFQMQEVPDGFALRQGAGIGLVGKYAGLYLKSLFHKPDDRSRSNVRVVKGTITSEYRKMWGIQDEYEKKSRDNHVHHCIDAITIACIEPCEYNATARYYQQLEEYERTKAVKPTFPKPWPTFTEDIKTIANEMLVVHSTPDNMPKHARKYVEVEKKGRKLSKGDSARGSLHNDTYYGAIERNGCIKYVIRKDLAVLKESDIDNIVDDVVKEKVRHVVEEKGFKEAMASDIFMNREKGIKIKKVRCFAPSVSNPLHIRTHRDVSQKEYKRQFHVTSDGNYCMAIYEGEVKGKMKRTYEIVNMIDAAYYFKESNPMMGRQPIIPETKDGLKYRCSLQKGKQIILLQSDSEEIDLSNKEDIARRLYHVAVMMSNGRVVLRYNQDARSATTLKTMRKSGAYKIGEKYRPEIVLSLSDFHALVEGVDFKIDVLGHIEMLK